MINRLIEFSMKNRGLIVLIYAAARGLGLLGTAAHADGRHSGPERKPGDRLHRLDGPKPAGDRGPGHVPAVAEAAGTRRRKGRCGRPRSSTTR